MIILKKINLSEILIRSFAVMTLVAMVIPSLAFLIPRSVDAATNQIRIYSRSSSNQTTSTDCKFVMERGVSNVSEGLNDILDIFSNTSNTPINSDATRDPNGFGADFEAVKNRYNDNQQLIYMYLLPVNTGSSGENGIICTNDLFINRGGGILFSRPSDPTKFFGYLRTSDATTSNTDGWSYYGTGLGGDGTFATAQFNTTTNTINFAAAGRSAGSYAVSAGSSSTGILDDAVFDDISPPGGGGSGSGAGFCGGADSPSYATCMQARIEDFGTLKYRGETYTLKSWRGDWMDYYLSSAITSRQSLASGSDDRKPIISISTVGNTGSSIDINIDGNPDGSESDKADENKEFFDTLNSLPDTVEVRFTDRDLSGGRIDANGNATTDEYQTITLNSVTNLRKIFKYYKQADALNFIPANYNPGDNEKRIVTPNLTVSPSNPLVYQATAISDSCSSENVLPKVVFTSDPKATNASVLDAVWSFPYNPTNCEMVSSNIKVSVDTTSTEVPDPVADGATAEPQKQECEDSFSSFGVIICWMLKFIDGTLGMLENIIKNLLFVDPGNYSATEINERGDSVQEPLYTAWISLARVASGLLVIFALIMVLGTALGDYKFFNAYTVKKVLPRIVVAAVGIWLSWAIVSAYIDSINVIGKGIADLLWTPFKTTTGASFEQYGLDDVFGSAAQDTGSATEAVAGTALGFTIIGGVVAAGAVALGGGLAILSALSPVLIFMLIGFVVLVLRQSVIIFLLAVAPIAVVSWILPNTKKLIWDKWLKFLNQLLFMFPMFMGVLAAGKIFAYVASTGGDGGLLSLIIPVIAYVTPFVLLPGIFKSAGGALSKVTGAGLKMGAKAPGQKALKEMADARQKVKAGERAAKGRVAQGLGYKLPFMDKRIAGTAGLARAAQRARSGQAIVPLSDSSRQAAGLDYSKSVLSDIGDKQKSMSELLSADPDALKALAGDHAAIGSAERARIQAAGLGGFIGNKNAQAAAVLALAETGRASDSMLAGLSREFTGRDKQAGASIISQAIQTSKSKGNITVGSMGYDAASGNVGYKRKDAAGNDVFHSFGSTDYEAAKLSTVSEKIDTMSTDDLAGLKVEMQSDSTKPGYGQYQIADDTVRDALASGGRAPAVRARLQSANKLTQGMQQALDSI